MTAALRRSAPRSSGLIGTGVRPQPIAMRRRVVSSGAGATMIGHGRCRASRHAVRPLSVGVMIAFLSDGGDNAIDACGVFMVFVVAVLIDHV